MSRGNAGPLLAVRNMLPSTVPVNAEALNHSSPSVTDAENWLALGAGALLLTTGASRRLVVEACLAVSSTPLLYRGAARA